MSVSCEYCVLSGRDCLRRADHSTKGDVPSGGMPERDRGTIWKRSRLNRVVETWKYS